MNKKLRDKYNANIERSNTIGELCHKYRQALLKIKAIYDKVFENCEGCGGTLCVDYFDSPDRCNDAKTLDIINGIINE